ncbi:TetR/AcrR family transcriptional regulator [Solimonas sp. K1W22B-7]|uniref:TetR/AcrR family transcriptional regulator n=1 Tax=Solimonas sp. K1W22B-7 TaxID=2303331 RepID=UPI000E336975|nr:TetR/AcrR family transcriptional regulator [Solimonas sp. K1W22B-7]AXQ30047.1 TetR/AcrR family transcriptional regulator [Solimonas sp. K1W22B-7]
MREKTKSAAPRKTRIRNPVQTRARLLQATVELLALKGPDGLSIKEAAQLAKVSRGVAYQHFQHREHLLSEAKGWITQQLIESMQGNGMALAAADDVMLHVARLILQNRDAATLLISDAIAGRELSSDHPINRLIRQSLERLKSTGEARADLDIEVLSYIFLGMTSTLVMLSRLPDSDPEDLAQRFTRELSGFMRQGIFSPPASGLRGR